MCAPAQPPLLRSLQAAGALQTYTPRIMDPAIRFAACLLSSAITKMDDHMARIRARRVSAPNCRALISVPAKRTRRDDSSRSHLTRRRVSSSALRTHQLCHPSRHQHT